MKVLKLLLPILLILSSCTKEDFTTLPRGPSVGNKAIKVSIEEKCSNYSPTPVDILLLVDNSGSVIALDKDLKSVVKELVSSAQGFFDYRIYIAPLVPESGETAAKQRQFQLIRSSGDNVSLSATDVGVNQIQLPNKVSGGRERGFKRAIDIIKNNSRINIPIGGTVFRNGAFLLVTTISNGDDNDFDFVDNQGNTVDIQTFQTRKTELLGIKTALSLPQLRYLSIVNHTKCGTAVNNPGLRYKTMSSQIYNAQGLSDSTSFQTPDSYNLCATSLSNAFANISTTIKKFRVGHRYNYWPLGSDANFDPSKLTITRKKRNLDGEVIGSESLMRNNFTNGFSFLSQPLQNFNIREYPTESLKHPAEKYSGYFVQLHGDAKVNYPDCLIIRKEDFTKYYGYIVIEQEEPDPSTIKVFIDGKSVAQGGVNGWEYLGFKTDQNILVESRSNPIGKTPGVFKSGYVIKLKGTSIFDDSSASGERGYVEFLPPELDGN